MKELLLDYLDKYRENLRINSLIRDVENIEVEFFSGIKKAYYYTPIVPGLELPEKYANANAWFVEIWIGGICVFRRTKTNEEQENLEQYEDECIKETMHNIMLSGLSNTYMVTKDRLKPRLF